MSFRFIILISGLRGNKSRPKLLGGMFSGLFRCLDFTSQEAFLFGIEIDLDCV